MTDAELIQGSEEWKLARVGSLGASRVHEATAKIKSGWGASRANVMADLIAERLSGTPAPSFTNAAMEWGTATEPEARTAYEFFTDRAVVQVGLIRHATIIGTHASPDGLIGDDGLLEIKCPGTSTHIDTLLGTPIAEKYLKQVYWHMACSGRSWCDWISYDPRLPGSMQLYIQRINRDADMIASLEHDVADFLRELEAKEHALRSRYSPEGMAA